MFIDVHTHAFHPKIAPKVLTQLEEHYGIPSIGTGEITDLLARANNAGLDKVAILCAATAAAQVTPANNYAIYLQENHLDNVVSFGTIHPEYMEWEQELQRLRKHGIRGIKLHPDFQGFRLDDPRLLPIIESAQHDFLFMVHVGDTLPPEENPSCPYKMAALLDAFPKARFIAAHLGGYLHWEHALNSIIGRNIYIDTSSSVEYIAPATLHTIFKKHPRDHILFGSDYPLFDPAIEREKLQRYAKLTTKELEEILGNGANALGLSA